MVRTLRARARASVTPGALAAELSSYLETDVRSVLRDDHRIRNNAIASHSDECLSVAVRRGHLRLLW